VSGSKAPKFANFYSVNLSVIAAFEAKWKPWRQYKLFLSCGVTIKSALQRSDTDQSHFVLRWI
jgi:hypothetical protein